MAKAKQRVDWDKLGAGASALCAVHCLITGIALGLLPVLGQHIFGNPRTDFAFLSVAALMGAIAFVQGFLRHRQAWPGIMFFSGIAMVVVSHTAFSHDHFGEKVSHDDWIATSLAVLGGLSLVAFHVLNLKLKAKCGCSYCRNNRSNRAPLA